MMFFFWFDLYQFSHSAEWVHILGTETWKTVLFHSSVVGPMGTDLISLHKNKASVILQHNLQPGWSQCCLHTAGTTVSVQFFTLPSPAKSPFPSLIVSANNQWQSQQRKIYGKSKEQTGMMIQHFLFLIFSYLLWKLQKRFLSQFQQLFFSARSPSSSFAHWKWWSVAVCSDSHLIIV